MNFIAILVASLIPLLIGFVWYNPKVFGTLWMKETGLDDEKIKGANMALIFGISIVFSIMLSMGLAQITIHQSSVNSALMNALNDPSKQAEAQKVADLFNGDGIYANEFRTFKHGAFHGLLFSLFLILPALGTNALFERKGMKYILINVGYWAVSMTIMGGIISVWK